MRKATDIEAFVHKCFSLYGLDYKHFHGEIVGEQEDEDGNIFGGTFEPLPVALDDKVDEKLLDKIATTLGLPKDVLLDLDIQAASVWYRRYPYFGLRGKFEQALLRSSEFSCSTEHTVLSAIFDENYKPENYKRYDTSRIQVRLHTLLAKFDTAMPGCLHKDAHIERLQISTDNFTSFPQIKELVEGYFAMVDRARNLFYKLWSLDLPAEEIREYNFLVSVLGMRDFGYSLSKPIYYKLARKYAPIYKEEGYKEYSSYIVYRGADFPPFWKCKEFYDYPDLVNRMVQEFPNTKSEMSHMVMHANNFLCSFIWSDEPMPTVSSDDDEYYRHLLKGFGDDTPSQYHRVFVPKTKNELCGDEDYIERCYRLSSPASKGGIKLPSPEFTRSIDLVTKRMKLRIGVKSAGGHHDD